MEHDDYLNERCDHDASVPMMIEIKWNQLVKVFRINDLPVISIDDPERYKDKLWNETNKRITFFKWQ